MLTELATNICRHAPWQVPLLIKITAMVKAIYQDIMLVVYVGILVCIGQSIGPASWTIWSLKQINIKRTMQEKLA